ncbi:DUF2140 family protein [Virgibacillus halophilus]|uniref:DUF2140 family protein n=1 Tax=Tigheibacillus halophilus TaxID=361280 RepID=A0ABU5C5G2_9BACI|nr:DUF2140 family protein [Virgibacillus halophilus]
MLSIDIIIIAVLLAFIFWPVQGADMPAKHNVDEEQSSSFTIRTTRKNLDELINAYLDKLLQDSKHHYKISLEDDVHLMGGITCFFNHSPIVCSLGTHCTKKTEMWC